MENEIFTNSMKIYIENEIIFLRILIKGEYTMDYAEENIIACRELLKNTRIKKKLFFVDPGNSNKMSLKTGKQIIEELIKYLDKMAILVKNPVADVIASFFLRMNKMPIPVKTFHNENDAIKWLKEN